MSANRDRFESDIQPRAWLPVVVWSVTALVVRRLCLDIQPLWFDEINTLYRADAAGLTGVLARIAADVQAPLYDLVMWPVVSVSGTGLGPARWPPLLLGVALVPTVMGLVRLLGGGRGALWVAGGWAALDPYLVRYGVECRPYALLALTSAATLWSGLSLVRSGGRRAPLFGVSCAALALSHYYGMPAAAAAALWVLASVRAWRARGTAVLAALALPLLAVLAWSPVALRQITTRSMGAIYGTLDGAMLLEIWDSLALVAPLAVPGPAAVVWTGRLLTALLAGLGLVALARVSAPAVVGPRGAHAAGRDAPKGASAADGAAAFPGLGPARWLLIAAGALLLVLGLALPPDALAELASRLVKQGRALDAENLAFLERVLTLAWQLGLLLGLLGLLLGPVLRWGARRQPPSPRWLLLGVAGAPLLVAGLLALQGQRTLAARNLILAAPVAIALASLGLARLPARARAAVLLVLLGVGGTSASELDGFLKRRDWPAVAAQLEGMGPTDIAAHPPWIARNLEHALGRPWNSVYGSYDPAAVGHWAASRTRVVLVSAFHGLSDADALRAALRRQLGAPRRQPVVTPGVLVELFERP